MAQKPASAPVGAPATSSPPSSVFCAAVGAELKQYDVDLENGSLVERASVTLPAAVQYAWPHVSKQYLYVVSSNRGPDRDPRLDDAPPGELHHLSALRFDPQSRAFTPHGAPVALPRRALHVTTDTPSQHVLVAYSIPSGVTVHRIRSDGTVGDSVPQSSALDYGIFAHQIRVVPSNTRAVLVTRGFDPIGDTPEQPGALKVFRYHDGSLGDASAAVSIAPGGGYGFGPRHLDFHPAKPWVYVSLERQHKLCLFTLDGDKLSSEPLFSVDTLAEPNNKRPHQMASTVHVHPNGRFVYVSERGSGTPRADVVSTEIGENTIIAYTIDQRTGEPTLVDRVPTSGMHPRTFSIDPSGRVLIAANKSPVSIKDGSAIRVVPASLDVFRIEDDGKLSRLRTYDIDVGSGSMFWTGFVAL